ncbi:hypothetical protein [Caulifigura coniformis]|nr:hypothetical protein [Caulifigura coniformis]
MTIRPEMEPQRIAYFKCDAAGDAIGPVAYADYSRTSADQETGMVVGKATVQLQKTCLYKFQGQVLVVGQGWVSNGWEDQMNTGQEYDGRTSVNLDG